MNRFDILAFALILGVSTPGRGLELPTEDPNLKYVELYYQAPKKCPTKTDVLDRISVLLRRSESADYDLVVARARITKTGKKSWTLDLKTTQAGKTGERKIEDGDCATLSDSASLIIALMLDPQAVALAESEPDPATQTEIPAGGKDEEPKDPTPPGDDTENGIAPYVVGSVTGDLGTLPKPALGGTIGAGIVHGRFAIHLIGEALGKRFGPSAGPASAGGDLWYAGGGLMAGWYLVQKRIDLLASVEVSAGAIIGTGTGISDPNRGAAFWLAPGAGLTASTPTTAGLRLHLKASFLAPVFRNQFFIQDIGVVHRVGPITGRLSMGLGWYF